MHTEMTAGNMRENGKKSLTVVLLCFNDGAVIGTCIGQAFAVLGPITSELQVIVVEDGSGDHSRAVLQGLKGTYPALEVIFHEQNRGYGRSLAEGIHVARNEYVLCSDGDNQFDFKDAVRLLELADGRYEVISGCRRPRADPWYRCALGWMYNLIVRMIFALQVQDVDCGFKLMNRRSAQVLFPIQSNLAVWVEAMTKAERYQYRCTNIMIHHRPRENGRSTVFNVAGVASMAWEIFSLGVRFRLLGRLPLNDDGRQVDVIKSR